MKFWNSRKAIEDEREQTFEPTTGPTQRFKQNLLALMLSRRHGSWKTDGAITEEVFEKRESGRCVCVSGLARVRFNLGFEAAINTGWQKDQLKLDWEDGVVNRLTLAIAVINWFFFQNYVSWLTAVVKVAKCCVLVAFSPKACQVLAYFTWTKELKQSISRSKFSSRSKI